MQILDITVVIVMNQLVIGARVVGLVPVPVQQEYGTTYVLPIMFQ